MPAVVLELYVLQKGGFPAHAHLAGVPLLRGQFMQLPPPPSKPATQYKFNITIAQFTQRVIQYMHASYEHYGMYSEHLSGSEL